MGNLRRRKNLGSKVQIWSLTAALCFCIVFVAGNNA